VAASIKVATLGPIAYAIYKYLSRVGFVDFIANSVGQMGEIVLQIIAAGKCDYYIV